MFIELHLIQNFAPSNLNRSDTGAPKDCEFGGHRRARISSQCLKRSIRKDAGFETFLAGKGGIRTRGLIREVAERVAGARPAPEAVLKTVAGVFEEGGLERVNPREGATEERYTTKLILFLDEPAIADMAHQFEAVWPSLQQGARDEKQAIRQQLGETLAAAVKAPDIALFGRMIEIGVKQPFGKLQLGVDAACQVAHAISTNKVEIEFDFYTAVDDLATEGGTGADMMGTIEFNSACFYRYAAVDLGQLTKNLGGDEELARRTLEAFIRASISAIPTGKQNSMAAQNRPSLVLAVARDRGLCSLANAFVKPVFPNRDGDLVQNSIRALDRFWGQMAAMYGLDGVAGAWVATPEREALDGLAAAHVAGVDAMVTQVLSTARFGANGTRAGTS